MYCTHPLLPACTIHFIRNTCIPVDSCNSLITWQKHSVYNHADTGQELQLCSHVKRQNEGGENVSAVTLTVGIVAQLLFWAAF